jgi:hypothetical protein
LNIAVTVKGEGVGPSYAPAVAILRRILTLEQSRQ